MTFGSCSLSSRIIASSQLTRTSYTVPAQMDMRGRRLHLAGTAAMSCPADRLRAAHQAVTDLVRAVIEAGGGSVLGCGDEPVSGAGIPCTFDWTILEAIESFDDPAPNWPSRRGSRFVVVASQRALEKIPEGRKALWRACLERSDIEIETPPPGWKMGGLIRARQVRHGDVLVALGGGAGTEQLAALYRDEGKGVVPVRADIGSLSDDGNGGSSYLHARALETPSDFFDIEDSSGGRVSRLVGLNLDDADRQSEVGASTWGLLNALRSPAAFYVRLLATNHEEFGSVEAFFRGTVDPVVAEEGYKSYEMGRDPPRAAFMNVEIFERIHRAALVVIDLSGVRPNCMMELGYALGRERAVVVTAKSNTQLPFDSDKLPVFFWDDGGDAASRTSEFRAWLERHARRVPLVA